MFTSGKNDAGYHKEYIPDKIIIVWVVWYGFSYAIWSWRMRVMHVCAWGTNCYSMYSIKFSVVYTTSKKL